MRGLLVSWQLFDPEYLREDELGAPFHQAARRFDTAAGVAMMTALMPVIAHYQRQNCGLIAFAAQGARLHPLPGELNQMLNLGVAVAVCNMIRRTDLANGFTVARPL
jgi:hypothetical protein